MDQQAAGPLVHSNILFLEVSANPAAEVPMAVQFSGLGGVKDKVVAVQGVVLRHREGPVHRVADGIVGGAVPAVGQIPAAIDFKQIGALQHVLGLGCKDGPAEGPVGQVGGSVFDHHAAQGVLMSSHQHPVALLVLVPEDFRVPEIIGGIVFRRIEGIFRQLGPGDLVAADRVHHALLAGAKGRGVSLIVAGAQSQIRVAEVPVRDHFPVVLIFVEIFGGKAIDRVIGLAVVVGVVEIVQLQFAVVHQGHHVADPGPF